MTGACCGRRLSTIAASILPGAVLVLLPKCPLCLAAWLTIVTGVSFPAAGAAWVRGIFVLLWAVAVALAAASMIRRRAFVNTGLFVQRLDQPRAYQPARSHSPR